MQTPPTGSEVPRLLSRKGSYVRDRAMNERTATRASRKPPVIGAVTIAGTTMLDDTTSPVGRKSGLLGGSAPYAALAAARYCRVRLVSVVGADGLDKLQT